MRNYLSAVSLVVAASSLPAATLVNDTWLDGNRTNQEAGVDSDSDGNIETAWFGTSGTLTATTGHLVGTIGSGSSSWTTYFAAEGSETTLAVGDTLTVTWTFSLNGVIATNNSQGFRLAFLDTPSGSRLSADGNPGTAAYAGYGMFIERGPDSWARQSVQPDGACRQDHGLGDVKLRRQLDVY